MCLLALRTNLNTILYAILAHNPPRKARTHFFHACRFKRETRLLVLHVEICKRVDLHAWKKWVRTWRGGLLGGSVRMVKSVVLGSR